jgi:hypothetical protein
MQKTKTKISILEEELNSATLVTLSPRDAARLRPHVIECTLDSQIQSNLNRYRVVTLPDSPLPNDLTDTNDFLSMVNYLPKSLIIIWNAIHTIDDDNKVTLNPIYMESAGLEFEDLLNLFRDIGITPFDEDIEEFEFFIPEGAKPVPLVLKSRIEEDKIPIDRELLTTIFNTFEPIPASTSENAELIRRQLFDFYIRAFDGLKITRLGISMLKREMKNRVAESVAPGQMPIGNICSDALAAQMMQSALDAKHSAGIGKSVGATSNLLREILRAIKNIKNLEMTAYFKNRRITPSEIDFYRKKYEYISLKELSTTRSEEVEGSFDNLVPEVPVGWAEKYAALEGFTIPDSNYKLQITIDVQKAYNRGITVDKIVKALKETLISDLKLTRPLVRFLVTPRYIKDEKVIKEGVTNVRVWIETKIFIIPDPIAAKNEIINNEKFERYQEFIIVKKEGRLRQFTLSILLTEVIEPLLANVYVSGIPGIDRVKTEYRVLTTYLIDDTTRKLDYANNEDKKIFKRHKLKEADDLWKIGLNERLIKYQFLELEDFEKLFTYLRYKVFLPDNPAEKDHIYVIPPPDISNYIDGENAKMKDSKKKISPSTYTIKLWNDEMNSINEKEKVQRDREIKRNEEYRKAREEAEITGQRLPRLIIAPPPIEILTDFILANRVYYIRTEGSNLREFLKLSEIDTRKLLSNNVHEILQVFGVGVARALIMSRISSVLGDDDKYIDPGYVMLIADVMTNRGKVFGIDFTGIKQHQSNILSLMSAERPTTLLITWASFSAEEKISGVSAQIMVGQPPTGGSGGVDIVKSEQLLNELANDLQPFSMDDITRELREIDHLYGPNMYRKINPVDPQPKKEIMTQGKTADIPAPLPSTAPKIPVISPALRTTAENVMKVVNIENTEVEEY